MHGHSCYCLDCAMWTTWHICMGTTHAVDLETVWPFGELVISSTTYTGILVRGFLHCTIDNFLTPPAALLKSHGMYG